MTQHQDAARAMARECVCFRARRLSRVLTRLHDEALRPLGIQTSQLTLLAAAAVADEAGTPMAALAAALAMDVTTLSRNVRPLERRGLIRIARSPKDARTRLVVLTPVGERLLEQAYPVWRRVTERVEAALGSAARELRDALTAAETAAGDAAEG